MIPVKAKDLIPDTAKRLELPEEDLKNMVSFYFKDLKRQMSTFEYLRFIVRGLGNMSVKGWALKDVIKTKKKTLSLSKNPDNIKKLEDEIALYEDANKRWLADEELKKQARVKKKQYYMNKLDKNELEGKDTSSLGE